MANKKPKKTVKSGIPKLDRYIRPEKEMLYLTFHNQRYAKLRIKWERPPQQ